MTNKEYQQILQHANGIVYSPQSKRYCQKFNITPDELLMQSYASLENPSGIIDIVAHMRRVMRHMVNFRGFGRLSVMDGVKQARCLKCRQIKPYAEFNLYANKFTKEKDCCPIWCRECTHAYLKSYYQTPKGRECRNNAFKAYAERNRESWNKYVQDRYKADKENLTDKYIVKLLKQNNKGVEITQEMIEAKREKLKQKRPKLT